MKLSILIPSIPSRFDRMIKIYEKLELQIKGREVEILVFIDNKQRSIGLKRDALVQMSKGDYIAFVDDDDDVSDDYIDEMLIGCEADKDVICFWQMSYIDGKKGLIDFDLSNGNLEFQAGQTTPRKPYHVCGWRGDLARKYRFEDLMYDEDRRWCIQLWAVAKTQYKIGKTLHTYTFDKDVTEAI